MALNSFTISGIGQLEADSVASNRYAIPGSGATLVLTNLGPGQVVFLLGDNTVAVTPSTGMALPAGTQSVPIAKGAATNIAVMVVGGQAVATVNIVSGT